MGLSVVAMDEVNLVRRYDDERSTSSSWPQGRPSVGSINEVHRPFRRGRGNVVPVDENDTIVVAVEEVDLVARSFDKVYLAHGYAGEINLAAGSVVPSRGRSSPRT